MMNLLWLLLITLVFLAIAAYDVPNLHTKRQWKELGVFSAILLLGYMLSIAVALGITPSVSPAIEFIRKFSWFVNFYTRFIINLL